MLKKNVISGHRKRKGLCQKCGLDPHDGDCIEIYNKTDNRPEFQPKPVTFNMDPERRILVIEGFRRKKKLCLICGQEPHDGDCTPIYDKADKRSAVEVKERPAIIPTPKDKPVTILEEMAKEKFQNKNVDITNQKTEEIKLQRRFIVLSVIPSESGYVVEFSCINQLSKKYKNHIICIIGDINKSLPYSDFLKLKRLLNIMILDKPKKDIFNYLHSSDMFLSFKNEYTHYCNSNSIKTYIFDDDKNATNFLRDSAFLGVNKL